MQYIKCLLLEPCNNPSYSGTDYYKSLSFSYLNADYNTKILNYVNVYTNAHNEISYKTQQNLSNSTNNRSYDALMLYNGLYGYTLDNNGKPESDNIIITHYPMLSNDPNINQYMYLYNVRASTLNNDSYDFYSISAEHILPVLIIIKDPWITNYLSKKIVQYDTWFKDESKTYENKTVQALGPRILTPDIYPLQLPHILDFLEITYATAELNTKFNNVSSCNINVNIYIKLTYDNHSYNNPPITWCPNGINTVDSNNAYYIKSAKEWFDGYIDEDTGAMKVGFIPIYDEYTWADGDMKQILLGNYAKIYWNRSLVTDSNDTAYILGTQNDAISFNGCFILITYNKNDLENKDYSYLRPITINSTNIMTQCYFGDKYNTGFLLKPNDPGCKIKYLKYSSSNYITVTPNDEQHDIFILLDNILSNILPNYNSSEHTYYTTYTDTNNDIFKVNHYIVCNSFRYWDEEHAELFKNFNIKSYQQTNGGVYEYINVSKNLSYCLGTLSCANDAANYIQFAFIVYDVFVFPEDYLNVIPLGFFTIDNVKYNIDRFDGDNITSYQEYTYGSIYYDTYINKSNASLDFIKANYPDILSISRTFLKDISNKYMYKTTLESGDNEAYLGDTNEYYPDLSNIHHTHNWYWKTQHPGNSANPGSEDSVDYTKYVNRYNVQQATGVSSTYYTDYTNDNDYFYTLYRASKEGLVYTTKDEYNNAKSYMYSSDTYKVWPNNYAALSLTEYSYSYSYLYYSY